ncbi:hypothetical protein [Nostoc sp.]
MDFKFWMRQELGIVFLLPLTPVLNAQCPMPNAQCPMPNAQCPIHT